MPKEKSRTFSQQVAASPTMQATIWQEIVSRYETLMTIRPTPIVGLNRAIAIGQSDGADSGLRELRTNADSQHLAKYPFCTRQSLSLNYKMATPKAIVIL
jgi:predicted RNA polymerase sigma factor